MIGLKGKELLLVVAVIVFLITPLFIIKSRAKKEKKMEEKLVSLRQPAVAGMFYPGEKNILEKEIKTFLNETRPLVKKEGFLRILIVPHAGYEYSGGVAAAGFSQLEGQDYSTIILLGVSHQAYFQGAVIDENDAWETPLGQVVVDKELAKKIVDEVDGVSFDSRAHTQEHSLEVELPFLQSVLSDFKIVPILLGEVDEDLLKKIADFLSQNLQPDTLVVISTDLSHYPPYEIANQVDKATIDSILTGDPKKFGAKIEDQLKKGYSGLATCACGEKAVKVGMMLAQKLGEGKWELIKYANSGDVEIGEKGRVVGYGAIGYYQKLKIKNEKLKIEEQKTLLEIARKTLESYLKDKKTPEFEIKEEELKQKLGAFVTLREDGQLRGCIGQIEPSEDPLWLVVQRMAIEAATKDFRFLPVTLDELKDIKIEISVLTKPEKIDDPNKIEFGKHGVIVKKGIHAGVFLPQVATENNWDLETFMGQLCSQKAGLPWDCWKKGEVDIYTFTAQVFEE